MNPGKLFIVSAPSGAGKTTLVLAAIEALAGKYPIERAVTYTTKSPRTGDVNGQDYHFISLQEFLEKAEKGFFLEFSTAYGNYYGTPRSVIDNTLKGISSILVIDRAGAKQIKQENDNVVLVWIDIPDLKTLENRLVGRKTETEKQLKQRLLLAKQELFEEKEESFYEFHIMNDIFEKALLELISVIFKSLGIDEKLKK